ncbi:MAG: hypothetical protein OXK72_01605 [Gammaproteobacteria bacterium]|nr:hypothetical protein [Gammaproteobacteria bacterium]MDE0410961.1 hypothetical protein [Gammaproteobacteria bacterium]
MPEEDGGEDQGTWMKCRRQTGKHDGSQMHWRELLAKYQNPNRLSSLRAQLTTATTRARVAFASKNSSFPVSPCQVRVTNARRI